MVFINIIANNEVIEVRKISQSGNYKSSDYTRSFSRSDHLIRITDSTLSIIKSGINKVVFITSINSIMFSDESSDNFCNLVSR